MFYTPLAIALLCVVALTAGAPQAQAKGGADRSEREAERSRILAEARAKKDGDHMSPSLFQSLFGLTSKPEPKKTK